MQNAVHWLPWGQEAFQKAKQEQKPVFLHIGFPSCHWCHVMERESFADAEVAALLNESFVPVHVDRERRPDVDAVYMAACLAVNGQGGWPLTALLTPGQQPFYVGTYLPRRALLVLLAETLDQWRDQRDRLTDMGNALAKVVRGQFDLSVPPAPMDKWLMESAVRAYASAFDERFGGMGGAPKFPMPHTVSFLLRQAHLAGDGKALSMAETALMRMAEGGLFDHVGGGFMRYATDRRWITPHYEKMLPDNALLAEAYTEAWSLTGRSLYRFVARRTLDYVLREMTDGQGGFFSSQDADTEGREGAYYLFTPKELYALLGREDGEAYCKYYSLEEGGLPHRAGHSGSIQTRRMDSLNERVYAYRGRRMGLPRDEKSLAAWNGLMIAALARAYTAFDDPAYLNAAQSAARCAKRRFQRPDGSLFSCWREGAATGEGLLDDYASLAAAALALHQATLDEAWLSWAVRLARTMLERFEDRAGGGFFQTPEGGEKLIARPKETYDGSQPSGNGLTLGLLVTLSMLDVGEGWAEAAGRQAAFLAGVCADAPSHHMAALLAAMPLVYPATLLEARADREENQRLLSALRGQYLPLFFLKAARPGVNGSTWRLCKGASCLAPFRRMDEAIAAMREN